MSSLLEKVIPYFGSFSKPISGPVCITFIVKIFLVYFRKEELNFPPLEKPHVMVLTSIFELRFTILMEKVAKITGDNKYSPSWFYRSLGWALVELAKKYNENQPLIV